MITNWQRIWCWEEKSSNHLKSLYPLLYRCPICKKDMNPTEEQFHWNVPGYTYGNPDNGAGYHFACDDPACRAGLVLLGFVSDWREDKS